MCLRQDLGITRSPKVPHPTFSQTATSLSKTGSFLSFSGESTTRLQQKVHATITMSTDKSSSLANRDTPIPVVQIHPADTPGSRTPNQEHGSHRLSASKLKDKLESLGDNMNRDSASRMGDRMINLYVCSVLELLDGLTLTITASLHKSCLLRISLRIRLRMVVMVPQHLRPRIAAHVRMSSGQTSVYQPCLRTFDASTLVSA